METELLIEVMSFGPMLTVLGNERFLNNLKARLQRQMQIAAPAAAEPEDCKPISTNNTSRNTDQENDKHL